VSGDILIKVLLIIITAFYYLVFLSDMADKLRMSYLALYYCFFDSCYFVDLFLVMGKPGNVGAKPLVGHRPYFLDSAYIDNPSMDFSAGLLN